MKIGYWINFPLLTVYECRGLLKVSLLFSFFLSFFLVESMFESECTSPEYIPSPLPKKYHSWFLAISRTFRLHCSWERSNPVQWRRLRGVCIGSTANESSRSSRAFGEARRTVQNAHTQHTNSETIICID